MSYPFDWNDVDVELYALVAAIDTARPEATTAIWPMVTNEFGMHVLAELWDQGFRIVPVPE